MATTHSVSSVVLMWCGRGGREMALLSGDVVWTGGRGMATTHSVSSVVVIWCGLAGRRMVTTHSISSGGEVVDWLGERWLPLTPSSVVVL
jgi:hypothetical protein